MTSRQQRQHQQARCQALLGRFDSTTQARLLGLRFALEVAAFVGQHGAPHVGQRLIETRALVERGLLTEERA